MVPEAQLAEVRCVLERSRIPHWVDEEAISLDGKPEITVINIGQGTNPGTIQKLLDSIP
jgi:hypothetical protein